MAKQTSKKEKKASKKKVAGSARRKAAAPKRKGATKTVAKKKKKKVAPKAKQAPRRKVAAKKKAKAKSTPKAKARSVSTRKTRGPKAAKRKPAARHPPLNLRRFRQRLRARQAELLQAYISTKVDSRSREIDGTEDYIDYAVSSYDREFLLSLTELEQNQLTLVEAALKRLDAREFGLCTQCEQAIPTKRLEVQPWAQYCLRCQELADQGLAIDDDDLPSDEDEGEQRKDAESDLEEDELPDEDRLAGGS